MLLMSLERNLLTQRQPLLANGLEKIKAKIARDAKLPDGLLGFVQGADEDSIREFG